MDKLGNKTLIGASATFTGKVINARVIEVNGKMNADLIAEKVTIGEAGHFDGAIQADLVVVSGHYEGKMQAKSIWATATASISGKLHYKTLQMDRGAALNCHIVHNWIAAKRYLLIALLLHLFLGSHHCNVLPPSHQL